MSFSLTSKSRSNPLCAPYYHAFDLIRNTKPSQASLDSQDSSISSKDKVVVVSKQLLDKHGRVVQTYDLGTQERSLWGKVSKRVKAGLWMVPVVGHVAYGLFKASEKVGLSGKVGISKLDQQRRTHHLTELMLGKDYEPLVQTAIDYKLQQAKELYVSERHRDEIRSFDDLREYLLQKFDRIVAPSEFDEAYQKLFSDYPEVQFTMDDLHSIVDFKKFEIFHPSDLMAIKDFMASKLKDVLSIWGVLRELREISSQTNVFLMDLNTIFADRDQAMDIAFRRKDRALKQSNKSNAQIQAEFNKEIKKVSDKFRTDVASIIAAQKPEYNQLSTERRQALCDIRLDMSNNLEVGNISELESAHVQLILSRLDYLDIPHTLNSNSSMQEVISWFHHSIFDAKDFHEAKTLRMVLNQVTLKRSVYSKAQEEVQLLKEALGKNLDLPEGERADLDEEARNLQKTLDNYRRFLSSSAEEMLSWLHQSIVAGRGSHEAKALRMLLNQDALKNSVYSEVLEEVQLLEEALGENLDLPEETRNLQRTLDNYKRFLNAYEKIFKDPEASKHSESYIISILNEPFQKLIEEASGMMSDFQFVNRVVGQMFKQLGKNLPGAKEFIQLADKNIKKMLGNQRRLSSVIYKPYIHSIYEERISSMNESKPKFSPKKAAASAPAAGGIIRAPKTENSPVRLRRRVSFSGIPGVGGRSNSEPIFPSTPRYAAPAAEPMGAKRKKTVSFEN
ncbi:MAG: hypothetical protein PVI40_00605 [Chlamydiota bacterium]|jgi:hypothetical protein